MAVENRGTGVAIYPTRCGMSIQLFFRPFSGCVSPLPGFFETITLAIGLDDMDPVCQAIQQGACQPFAAHHLHPVLEWQIRRHDQTGAFIGPTNQSSLKNALFGRQTTVGAIR